MKNMKIAPFLPAVARKLPLGCHANITGPTPWYFDANLNNFFISAKKNLIRRKQNGSCKPLSFDIRINLFK